MTEKAEKIRKVTKREIATLEKQGCYAMDWSKVIISSKLDIKKITNVYFSGDVTIHENVELRNIPGGIGGCTIRRNARVINVDSIEFEPEANHGVGTVVSVLDETGSRPVKIYPGISAQIATLMTREPKWVQSKLPSSINEFIDSRVTPAEIGEGALIKNCGIIKNVSIGPEIEVAGAQRLVNGSLINNAHTGKCFTYIGNGVEAENFIVEDGRLESGASIVNSYVGQGAVLAHGFSAHDSLFFANCSLENGEAHALFAGPYTVSMHKGTLLIGCQTSFMNAGSLTNQSNHMYKLGPVHWGLLERGVKTASGSYLMLGAKIGAFSMLMGSHKSHPDSSEFPFSYLFGDERGATVVVPAVMLRSCGLLRDEMKWPTRDRRLKRKLPLFDRINFNVLNPFTVDTMLNAIHTIEELLTKPADDDLFIRYKGMRFTRAALERARSLYTIAIFKYLSLNLPDGQFPENDGETPQQWIDLSGEIMPLQSLEEAMSKDSIPDAEEVFDQADLNFKNWELKWIGRRFGDWWRERQHHIAVNAEKFDEMVEDDRQQYLQMLAREAEMLALNPQSSKQ